MAPRDPDAKARVSRNALKHGLRAQKHLVLDYEDPRAFEALRVEVHRDLKPVGPIERSRADRIALCIWQQTRVARIQAAAMNYSLQETLAGDDDTFTPDQRVERALIACVNNESLEPIHRYDTFIDRQFNRAMQQLQASKLSRRTGVPISPGSLRITVPAQLILPEISEDVPGDGKLSA